MTFHTESGSIGTILSGFESQLLTICLNDQANIAWFTSTRGVYQVWLDMSLFLEFAQDESQSQSVTNFFIQDLKKVHLYQYNNIINTSRFHVQTYYASVF